MSRSNDDFWIPSEFGDYNEALRNITHVMMVYTRCTVASCRIEQSDGRQAKPKFRHSFDQPNVTGHDSHRHSISCSMIHAPWLPDIQTTAVLISWRYSLLFCRLVIETYVGIDTRYLWNQRLSRNEIMLWPSQGKRIFMVSILNSITVF